VSWLLFAPVIIHIDTGEQAYYIKMPLILKFQLIYKGARRKIVIRLFHIPFSFGLGDRTVKDINKVIIEKGGFKFPDLSRVKNAPVLLSLYLKYLKKILRTFRLKKLRVRFDTGDYALNARLIPVVLLARNQNLDISVNFTDENSLLMIIQNRLYRLLWQGIKFYLERKKS
jgi:hypothetical protein